MKIQKNTIVFDDPYGFEDLFTISVDEVLQNFQKLYTKKLSKEHQEEFLKELLLFEEIFTKESLLHATKFLVDEHLSIKEQIKNLNEWTNFLQTKGISPDFLDCIITKYEDNNGCSYSIDGLTLGMKPNQWFPMISSLELKNNYTSLVSKNTEFFHNYEKKLKKLQSCKD